jgi:clan AA aspartic protease (TIGR02281 family)
MKKSISLKFPVLLFLALLFCFQGAASADTLFLKNGRKLEGIIKNIDGQEVELEYLTGSVKFDRSRIERIERSTFKESEEIREDWARQQKEREERAVENKRQQERLPREVGFSKTSQSIIVVASLNNEVNVSLILDTGAALVVLKKSIAGELGIDLDRSGPEIELVVADGRRVKARSIILNSVEVEGVQANNVQAAVIMDEENDSDFGDGLLGMSFLRNFNFKIDHANNKIILEKL